MTGVVHLKKKQKTIVRIIMCKKEPSTGTGMKEKEKETTSDG